MGRTKQEKIQIEHRRTQVAELYLKKWTQAAIARELGVSQATVSNDIKAIRKEWLKSRIQNYDEAIMEEIKSIDIVNREALDAWQRSQQPAETTRVVQKNGEKRAEKTLRQSAGDPRFLRVALDAIEKRSKLLGLNEQAKAADKTSDQKSTSGKLQLDWDTILGSDDSDWYKKTIIDDDYIERYLEKSRASPGEVATQKNLSPKE